MKKIVGVVVMVLVLSVGLKAQTPNDPSILTTAEQMPEYPGGIDSLIKEITTRIVYPQACLDSGIQGKVYLRFIVNENGSVTNVEAIKGPHPLLKEAAVAATKEIGKFKPAMQKGKEVKVYYGVPVNFKIKTLGTTDTVYKVVDVPAEYPGGEEQLQKDLAKNLVYPKTEFINGIEGSIELIVIIDTSGLIHIPPDNEGVNVDDHVLRFFNEAVRVVKLLSKFKPAYHQGRNVSSFYTVHVTFKLQHIENTIYLGGMNSITVSAVVASVGGKGDNRGRFLFYYYKDGYDAFMKSVAENMVYPPEAAKDKLEGIVRVQCRINEKFKLEPVSCLNDPENIFAKEAFRLISLASPFTEEINGSSFLHDTLPVDILFVLDKRHQWGASKDKDETQAEMLIEQGITLFNKLKYEKAEEYFLAAIRYYSLSSKAFFNLAATELKLNKTVEACADFKRAFLLGDLDAKNAIMQTCK